MPTCCGCAAVHQAKGVTSTAALTSARLPYTRLPARRPWFVSPRAGRPPTTGPAPTRSCTRSICRHRRRAWASGETVNEASDRFGFRQFWREGDKYIFNGVKIRLRGDLLRLLNQGNCDLINEESATPMV